MAKRAPGRRKRPRNYKNRTRQWGSPTPGWLVGRMMLQEDGNYQHEWLLFQVPTMAEASMMADMAQGERKSTIETRLNKRGRKPTYLNPAMP